MSDSSIVDGKSEPAFYRKLKCATDEITDDVSVDDKQLMNIFVRIGPLDILFEGGGYSDTISIFLLGPFLDQIFRPRGNRCGKSFTEKPVLDIEAIGEIFSDNFSRFLGSSQFRDVDIIELFIERF